jgi:type IV pilus assembly protein PilO
MMNYDVKKMYEWPLIAQIFIIILVCLFIIYLGYFIDLIPLKNQINTTAMQEDDLKQQYKVSLDQQVSTTSDIEALPQMKQLLDSWEKRLITSTDLPTLLDSILKLGQENGLKFNLFDPGTEVKQGKYTMIPVRINMTGTYDQIASFMSDVANMQNLVVIGNFALNNENAVEGATSSNPEPLNSDLSLTADLTLEIYRL